MEDRDGTVCHGWLHMGDLMGFMHRSWKMSVRSMHGRPLLWTHSRIPECRLLPSTPANMLAS